MANLRREPHDRTEFGSILREARQAKGLSQEKVAGQMNAVFTNYRQKKISRLELGQQITRLPEAELALLGEILGLSLEEWASAAQPENPPRPGPAPRPMHAWTSPREDRYLSTRAESPEFDAYLGTYHGIFRSTNSREDRLNRTILELFTREDGTCGATLVILDDGGVSIKRYEGIYFVNTHFQVGYFLLSGLRLQEVSMMIAPHFVPTVETIKNKYIVAQALTSSSGSSKHRTVAHRMLLSRKRLTDRQAELARSQLLLNTDMIQIRLEQLQALEDEAKRQLEQEPTSGFYQSVLQACGIIRRGSQEITLLQIEESKIFDAKSLGRNDTSRALVTAMLRNYAEGFYHNKVSETVRETFEAIIDSE